jgi:outer membrane protein, multidrug efflux system
MLKHFSISFPHRLSVSPGRRVPRSTHRFIPKPLCTRIPNLALIWVLAIGFGALAGCAVGPDFRSPRMLLPEAWRGASAPQPDQASAAAVPVSVITPNPTELGDWWRIFNDPMLSSLVERALTSNLDLALAKSRIRQARASRGVASAGLWPEVDASASYRRSSSGGSSTGNSPTSASSSNTDSSVGGKQSDLFRAGLDAVWELDIFGGKRRNVEAAEADLYAAVETRRDVLVSLVAEVGNNYVTLRSLQQQLAIAQDNLRAQTKAAEIARKRFEAGYVGALDVATANAQVATLQSQIPVLESTAQATIYSLGVLLGHEPASLAQELAPPASIPVIPPEVPVGLPSALLLRRPDIRKAEAQLHAATARVGVATADLFPKFSLTGSLGFSSSDLASLANWGSHAWSMGPSVNWLIFDAGRIRANIEVQNALQEQALLTYQKTVLTALKEVETALTAYAKEHEQRRALTVAVVENRRAVSLSMELYVAGRTNFLSVLIAQRSLYVAEESLALSTRNQATDLIALYKALGGGWEIGIGHD